MPGVYTKRLEYDAYGNVERETRALGSPDEARTDTRWTH